MDEGGRRPTPRLRPRTQQRTRSLGTFRTRIPKQVPGFVETAKGKGLTRWPPHEMARHRRLHLFFRRITPACRIHRRKQRKRKPLPPRTPPLYRHRGDETPAPRWLRRDEAEGHRRYEVESDHSKHVRQSRQPKGVECRKLAKHVPTT